MDEDLHKTLLDIRNLLLGMSQRMEAVEKELGVKTRRAAIREEALAEQTQRQINRASERPVLSRAIQRLEKKQCSA